MASPNVNQAIPPNNLAHGDQTSPDIGSVSPIASERPSRVISTPSSAVYHPPGHPPYFRSRKKKKEDIEKPWLTEKKDPREKWVTIIPCIGIVMGLIAAGILVWDGLRSVTNFKYCMIMDEDWSNGFDTEIWQKEVELGGYGNGQFEQTTGTDENVFIEDNILYIKPTLQDESLIENDSILDLREDGCTSDKWANCYAVTNTTNGTIINPVKSGRISTKPGKSIKYGRVEVTAKLPAGDWLWPAIWMLPTESVYGEWPKSGEIDIMESRGNNRTYGQGGNNIVSSTLHFGPDPINDAWWRNNVKRNALHSTYADGYHTFGVEWSEKYIFTYIDTRLLQVSYTYFDQPFWDYGSFPLSDGNGTRLENPWAQTGSNASPFDQDFYVVINLAVGGTNGWFKDGKSGKPWLDRSPVAKKDFYDAREQWYPTWEEHGGGVMQVKRVKMWQQAGYNDCDEADAVRYGA